MAAKYEDNNHSWKFKNQRPDKVPGCQDTRWLPTLGEGQASCEEGQQCYYFSCGKCSSSLALDVMNSRYKTDLEYIPRIPNIESPDAFKKDNKYYQFHGEMFELYFKFFAQVKELTRVAFNGWSNLDAQRIFDGVPETFQKTKFPKTKDFEIDWILFNGSTITVIEVKANTEDSKSKKNFQTKMKQLNKDQIVMQRLLGATVCENVKVNYIIACPNISIKEVTKRKTLNDHREIFQTITSLGCGLGFISEESILKKSVYVYDTNKGEVIEELFVDFVEQSDVLNGHSVTNQTSALWSNAYKLAASSIVISMLMIGSPAFDIENNPLTAKDRSDPTEAYTERSIASSMETRKVKPPKIPGVPVELRKHFPEHLLLGPEQLEVITCKSNRILMRGEPGTGKTCVLLALLFLHTAKVKHSLQSPNFKKVLFFVHESKTEFRKYAEAFIDKHCDKTYAKVMPVCDKSLELSVDGDAKFILCDECPTFGFNYTFWDEMKKLSEEVKLVWTITYSTVSDIKFLEFYLSQWKTFHLKNAYRCPTNIALRYTKIRRKQMYHYSNQHYFLSLSNSAPHFVDENSIQILKYTEDIRECELPEQQFVGESLLVVIIDLDDTDFNKVDTMFADATDHCFTYRTISKCKIPLEFDLLDFTGVQYHTAVIIVGAKISRNHEFMVGEILYHAVSRSLRRLIVLCHDTQYDWISSILSLDNLDLRVFMKLRKGEQIYCQDISWIKTKVDLSEALEILIIRKDYTQLNRLLKYVLGSNLNQYLEEVMIRSLGRRMENLEEHDLLGLLESVLLPDSNFEFFGYFFIHFFRRSTFNMRNIFLTLQPQYHVNWKDFISQQHLNFLHLMAASVVWLDSKMFSIALRVFKASLKIIMDTLLEISIEMPDRLKCHLQPYDTEVPLARFGTKMHASLIQYLHAIADYNLDSIGKTIITEMSAAASNLCNCSTCSRIMELVILQNNFPIRMKTQEGVIGLILDVIKSKEMADDQTANWAALNHVAQELEKRKLQDELDDKFNNGSFGKMFLQNSWTVKDYNRFVSYFTLYQENNSWKNSKDCNFLALAQ